MDWLNRLLAVDAPPGTTLQSAQWTLRGVLPAWLMAALVVAFAAGSVWLYLREPAQIGWRRRLLLAGLRTAALGVLVVLLARPVLLAEFGGERPRGVAILLDNSQSLQQKDRRVSPRDRLRVAIARGQAPADASPDDPQWSSAANEPVENPTRAQMVRWALESESLSLLPNLQRVGPLRLNLFGQAVRSIADNPASDATESLLREFTTTDARTALADSVTELLQRRDGDLPAAVVVVTDGIDNASKTPLDEAARECARLGVPIHVYGVGSSEAGILQLKDAGIPPVIFYEDTVSVPVRWRGQGFKDGAGILSLTLGGRVVASRQVSLRDGELGKETLTFTPQRRVNEREEKQDMAVTLRSKDDASYFDEVKKPVRLVDRRVKVLVVDSTPRWEFKFLQPTLQRDRRVDASFFLTAGDPRLMRSGPPFLPEFPTREKLFGFDLVILGDVPSNYLGHERMTMIQEFVREGGGLVVVAGRNAMPATYENSPLAEVLPVEFIPTKFDPESAVRPQAFVPERTPAGERADMLMLTDAVDENRLAWRDLPGWYWHYPVTKLRPGATSLLGHPKQSIGDQQMPLLATHLYGKGQVLFLAADETWRWRYNAQEKLYARFWGQVVYQVGLPHLLGNAARVQMALERGEAVLGRPGYVYAHLFDTDFHPLIDQRIHATLEALDLPPGEGKSREVPLEVVSGRPGEYRAYLPHDVPGRFELRLTRPEPFMFGYRVELPPHHELEPAGMADDSLRELASVTGGRFYREEDLPKLVESIVAKNASFTLRREILLWNPLSLLVFIALVTTEWVIRKFVNLI
jgi:hypothetical protein